MQTCEQKPTYCDLASPISDVLLVLYKTSQQVGKTKIAVEWRSKERKKQLEDVGRCCRGGDNAPRYHFGRELFGK